MDTLILMAVLSVGCFVVTYIEQAEHRAAVPDTSVGVTIGRSGARTNSYETLRLPNYREGERFVLKWFREKYIKIKDVRPLIDDQGHVIYTGIIDRVKYTASIR